MNLPEKVVVGAIIGILAAIAFHSYFGLVSKMRVRSAAYEIATQARQTRYEYSGSRGSLCFRQGDTVEFISVAGNDCPQDISVWRKISLTGILIETNRTTLRSANGKVAGSGSDYFRMSWGQTGAGTGGTVGQVGALCIKDESGGAIASIRNGSAIDRDYTGNITVLNSCPSAKK